MSVSEDEFPLQPELLSRLIGDRAFGSGFSSLLCRGWSPRECFSAPVLVSSPGSMFSRRVRSSSDLNRRVSARDRVAASRRFFRGSDVMR